MLSILLLLERHIQEGRGVSRGGGSWTGDKPHVNLLGLFLTQE
jgi:hypothetical protein